MLRPVAGLFALGYAAAVILDFGSPAKADCQLGSTCAVSTKRKKGKPVTKFKRDKRAKAGVKVKASKPR